MNMNTVMNFFSGRFGKYRLVQPIRKYYQIFLGLAAAYLIVRYMIFPLFDAWEVFIRFVNHVVWG